MVSTLWEYFGISLLIQTWSVGKLCQIWFPLHLKRNFLRKNLIACKHEISKLLQTKRVFLALSFFVIILQFQPAEAFHWVSVFYKMLRAFWYWISCQTVCLFPTSDLLNCWICFQFQNISEQQMKITGLTLVNLPFFWASFTSFPEWCFLLKIWIFSANGTNLAGYGSLDLDLEKSQILHWRWIWLLREKWVEKLLQLRQDWPPCPGLWTWKSDF